MRAVADAAIVRFGEKALVENILQVHYEDASAAPGICDLSGFGWYGYEVDPLDDLRIAEKGLEGVTWGHD